MSYASLVILNNEQICLAKQYSMAHSTYVLRAYQRRSQSSGDEGEMSHRSTPCSSGSLPKIKTSLLLILFSKCPSQALNRPSQAHDGLLGPKIDPCRPGIDPPEAVNCLLSLNADSEDLQYLIIWIENGSLD